MFRNQMQRNMSWHQGPSRNPSSLSRRARFQQYNQGFQHGMGRPGNRGLLSRLFQRQSGPQSASMFSRGSEQTSLLQGIANPERISNFLSQTQQVLNTAQQFGPMIQQYGPLVKNLPAMWKLYQGFKNMPDSETEEKSQEEKPAEKSILKTDIQNTVQNSNDTGGTNKSPKQQTRSKKTGESIPKLYIP